MDSLEGDCFSAAYETADRVHHFVIDLRVVHGTPINRGPRQGERYWHAWVEVLTAHGWHVLDNANGLDVNMPKMVYYALGHIEEQHVWLYTTHDHRLGMIERGTYGPWVDGWEQLAL